MYAWRNASLNCASMFKLCIRCPALQTAFTTDHSNPQYNYEDRREALRLAWVPGTQAERDALLRRHNIVVEFVIGHSSDPQAEALVNEEEARFGGFLRLGMQVWLERLIAYRLTTGDAGGRLTGNFTPSLTINLVAGVVRSIDGEIVALFDHGVVKI